MNEMIEKVMKELSRIMASEGKRYLELKAMKAGIEAVKAARRLALIHYVLVVFAFIEGLSFFTGIFFLFRAHQQGNSLLDEPYLIFCLGVFTLSTAVSIFLFREKTWIKMTGLERAYTPQAPRMPTGEEIEKAVERAVERAVEKKLKAAPPESRPN